MPADLIAFVLFAIAMSVTPGPNNIMVATGSASNGIRATMPHMLGISLGFGAMVLIVGLGLAGPLAAAPAVHAALRIVGGAWMIWIAWNMVAAQPTAAAAGRVAPMGFGAAALFQWVNPKAWVISVVATATYTTPGHGLVPQVLLLAAVFIALSMPCLLLWSLLGAGAGRVLHSPGQMRAFNAVMAGLLVLSIVPMLAG